MEVKGRGYYRVASSFIILIYTETGKSQPLLLFQFLYFLIVKPLNLSAQ